MRQQALLMGLDDAFFFGAVVFALLAGAVWLARGPAPRAKPALEPDQGASEAEGMSEQPY